MSGYANETLVVDRVGLRDGFKPLSIVRVFGLVKDVRRRKFDFVIDLHSLSETNLLGFFSGASKRLYARRPGRSLDYLAIMACPPVETDHRKRHLIDRYLDVLIPLEVKTAERFPKLKTRPADDAAIENDPEESKSGCRCAADWIVSGCGPFQPPLASGTICRTRRLLNQKRSGQSLVFIGPEEQPFVKDMRKLFPSVQRCCLIIFRCHSLPPPPPDWPHLCQTTPVRCTLLQPSERRLCYC